MLKKISFFVIGNSGSPVRQIAVSNAFAWFLFLFVATGVAGVGGCLYDYVHLRQTDDETVLLRTHIAGQQQVIIGQRKQINTLAQEINALKAEIVVLNEFEKKIRIIANIEESDDQDGLFGVGGPIPADLDTKISPREKHDGLLRDMREQTQQLQMASVHQENQFASLVDNLEDQVTLLASTPAIRPAGGWTTCGFGYRKSPFTGLREFHKGIDIANRKGSPIIATADGVVTFAGRKGLLGKLIIINHGHGMVTRYGHAKKLLKKRGDRVKRGEKIAMIGNTGRTTGSHVHYEVLLNGVPVNPKKYILN